ncbi:MAG: hypothetical protein OEY33_09630 [Bdellovibrionales bacterium]|nr:hypothetical protein [Bdellovibrionales bacterium]
MKKKIFSILAVLGLMSTSTYANAFDVIMENTTPDMVNKLKELDKNTLDSLNKRFESFIDADDITREKMFRNLLIEKRGSIYDHAQPCGIDQCGWLGR